MRFRGKSLVLAAALAAVSLPTSGAVFPGQEVTPLVHAGAPHPAYRIAVMSNVGTGKSLALLVGVFVPGMAEELDAILTAHPEITGISLISPGGSFSEGLSVGEVISNHRLETIVPPGAVCASACAFAFLGGARYRVLGVLAFHRPYLFPSQMVSMSMSQVSNAASAAGAQSVLWCIANGFVFRFAQVIAVDTNPDRFMVFTNAAQLAGYENAGRSIDGIFGAFKRFTLFSSGEGLGAMAKMIKAYRHPAVHSYRISEIWSQGAKP